MTGLTVTRKRGVACLTLGSPILDTGTLAQLRAAVEELSNEDPVLPLVLTSDDPRIFLAGAHLAEIAALNPKTCLAYARFGRAVINAIAHYRAPTVAAVNGACAGGGLDLLLACDAVILGPSARCAHPGVKRGLVTGWGGTSSLPGSIGRQQARKALLEAGDLEEKSLLDAGFVLHRADGDPSASAIRQALWLSGLHPARMAAWRTLKSGRFIDRFRIFVILNGGTTRLGGRNVGGPRLPDAGLVRGWESI